MTDEQFTQLLSLILVNTKIAMQILFNTSGKNVDVDKWYESYQRILSECNKVLEAYGVGIDDI